MNMLRIVLGIATGMVVAFALVLGVEWFSSIVHPFPPDFDGNIPEHVKRYPGWVLGLVVPAWGAAAAAATSVASRVGGRAAGVVVVTLLAWGLTFNLTKLPYAIWFKVAMACAFPAACLLGLRRDKRAV
jgi:hypothetical protein